MPWIQPKTNWENGEVFDLDPDYERIKGDIEYLIEVGQERYPELVDQGLGTYTIHDLAPVSFFTDIVNAITYIKDNTFAPIGWRTMRTYYYGKIWNADDLNAIEHNLRLLHDGIVVPGKVYYAGKYLSGQIPGNVISDLTNDGD